MPVRAGTKLILTFCGGGGGRCQGEVIGMGTASQVIGVDRRLRLQRANNGDEDCVGARARTGRRRAVDGASFALKGAPSQAS